MTCDSSAIWPHILKTRWRVFEDWRNSRLPCGVTAVWIASIGRFSALQTSRERGVERVRLERLEAAAVFFDKQILDTLLRKLMRGKQPWRGRRGADHKPRHGF